MTATPQSPGDPGQEREGLALTAEEREQVRAAAMHSIGCDGYGSHRWIRRDLDAAVERVLTARVEQARAEVGAEVAAAIEALLAKYEGRSKWVGYEQPRREAWAEIERDLRNAARIAREVTGGTERSTSEGG